MPRTNHERRRVLDTPTESFEDLSKLWPAIHRRPARDRPLLPQVRKCLGQQRASQAQREVAP